MGPSSRRGRPGFGRQNSGKSRFTVGSDERPSRSTSRTTSSRSQSKSKSRTPSPILDGNAAPSTIAPTKSEPLRRSNSSLSPSYQPGPPPPTRGRSQQDILQRSNSASSVPSSRGRSISRTSSNPSIETSTSPFGSMSPDAAASRYASAIAYVGGGRLERERTGGERRGREVVRERERGRDRTTDKRLSVSVSCSPEPPSTSRESSMVTATSSSTDAAASSASSTSSSKTIKPEGKTEEDFQREAEEMLRKAHPTPSNSPVIQMRAPPAVEPERETTPASSGLASGQETPTRTNGPHYASPTSPTPTKSRLPPPPLIPSPSIPALPSTSYTAVSSPSPTSPSVGASPHLKTAGDLVSVNGTSPLTGTPSRHKSNDSTDSSIIGKASEIVSNAGAFFGLWNHSSSS